MPAATDKQALLDVTRKEYAKLRDTIAGIDGTTALAKDDDDTSIKDVIAHRAHWIHLFLGWHRDGAAGRSVEFPAPGYKWNELKRYNADLRARQAAMGWDDAKDALAEGHATLLALIEGLSDAELYGGPMPGGRNAWTTGRWAEAAGASHYRSASKYVRGALRAAPVRRD